MFYQPRVINNCNRIAICKINESLTMINKSLLLQLKKQVIHAYTFGIFSKMVQTLSTKALPHQTHCFHLILYLASTVDVLSLKKKMTMTMMALKRTWYYCFPGWGSHCPQATGIYDLGTLAR